VRRTESGLTIVELLIAMAVLGVLLSVIVGPITSLFQITNNSNRQLAGTAQAQRVVERFKGVGNTSFDRNCLPLLSTETSSDLLPSIVSAQIQYLNPDASPTAAAPVSLVTNTNCGSLAQVTNATITLKRLTLTVTQGSQTSARIIIDVPRSTTTLP
jgi:prepilin-type N-terminal cleavage/methylation domain-containing protein